VNETTITMGQTPILDEYPVHFLTTQ